MYSDELEKLIEMALLDGELTDKEKQILCKKAKSFGIDLDEFEMVLEARLYERIKDKDKDKIIPSTSKSEKLGNVRKCPACGAILQSFSTQCLDCGYEITNISANNSVKLLSEKLENVVVESNKINFEDKSLIGQFVGENLAEKVELRRKVEIQKRQKEIIENFPIPNTREDILEFLHYISPKVKISFGSNKNVTAWRNKYKEVLSRAEFAFSNDTKMMTEIDKFKKQQKTTGFMVFISWIARLSKNTKVMIGSVLFYLVLGILLSVIIINKSSSHDENVVKEKTRLEKIMQDCQTAISEKDYVQAEILVNELRWGYSDSYSSEDTDREEEVWNERRNYLLEMINELKSKKK